MVDEGSRMRRKRSPSYPYVSLEKALNLIKVLYKQEGYNYAHIYTVLEHLNYSQTSSSGARIIATLLQFGLLDETGSRDEKRVRLSDISMSIVEAPDDRTRLDAIREAALNPDIHREVWEYWDLDTQPLPSSSNMRYTLLREFGFHKNAVDAFIEQFKHTYFFAQLDQLINKQADEAEDISAGADDPDDEQRPLLSTPESPIPQGMRQHTIQLIGQPMASLILPHPISARNLRHLINWLELMGPALTIPEGELAEVDESDDLPF